MAVFGQGTWGEGWHVSRPQSLSGFEAGSASPGQGKYFADLADAQYNLHPMDQNLTIANGK